MKRISDCIAVVLCAVCTMLWVGTVNATLIGDTVTVGRYSPDSTTPLLGAMPPATFIVGAGPTHRIRSIGQRAEGAQGLWINTVRKKKLTQI